MAAAVENKPARRGGRRGTNARGAGFLERLGIVGYRRIEPVLLAALALKAPVLLVGAHGTAKSLLVECVANELALGFRHYNAALLSYDDLVGIPMPDETGAALRFIGTPGAIWGAGFAFFDEISRCRADLQNKLFPVIHERRVAGVDLPELRHRWAAMNPPAGDDDALDSLGAVYLGSECLDPALADRFAFVVPVPGWRDLTKRDRLRLVAGTEVLPRRKRQAGAAPRLATLVSRCAKQTREVEERLGAYIADYVVHLVELLGQGELAQSPRRARMLARNVAAVHAARLVLEGEDAHPDESAELALRYGVPQTAEPVPPAAVKLVAAHRQAWEVAGLEKDDVWRQILAEPDPSRRVALGARLGLANADLARLVTHALGEEPSDSRRIGLATAMFLGFREHHALTPAAWEALARLARRVLEPENQTRHVGTGPDLETWREISAHLVTGDENRPAATLERAFLHAGFPDQWRSVPWREALARFHEDLATFGAGGGAA